MKLYTIQHKETGKFSRGGSTPKFTKNGKVWTGLGHVKMHLQLAFYNHYNIWNRRTEVEFDKSFMVYEKCELITNDTETFEMERDDKFLIEYLRKKAKLIDDDPRVILSENAKRFLL